MLNKRPSIGNDVVTLFSLVCILTINCKCAGLMTEDARMHAFMGNVENVLVESFGVESKCGLSSKHLARRILGHEFDKILGKNGPESPGSNGNYWGFVVIGGKNPFHFYAKSEPNILGASSSVISEFHYDSSFLAIQSFLREFCASDQEVGTFSKFQCRVCDFRPAFSCLGRLSGNSDVSFHPSFMLSKGLPLQVPNQRKHTREYYEQGVVYFLYCLGPVVFLGCAGGYLTFGGPRLFRNRFGALLSRVGNGLVCFSFVYLFLGTLFVGSGLLL